MRFHGIFRNRRRDGWMKPRDCIAMLYLGFVLAAAGGGLVLYYKPSN